MTPAGDVILAKKAELPPVCVKCGNRDELDSRRLNYPGDKRYFVTLPICRECDGRWTTATMVVVSTFFGLLALGWFHSLAWLLLMPVPFILQPMYARPRKVWIPKVDKDAVWLRGLCQVAAHAACTSAEQSTTPK